MLKKFMAKMGVGSAKVDLMLSKSEYAMDEIIHGTIRVQGGNVEQEMNSIAVELWLQVVSKKGQTYPHKITSIPVVSPFIIQANEVKDFPFTYKLPEGLPISAGNVSYHFRTHLDIAGGVDSNDHDAIRILAPAPFYALLEAFGRLGFREKHGSGYFDGFKQEFELFPTGLLAGQVQEVEFQAAVEQDGLRILLELDVPSFGREVELKREIFFSHALLEDVDRLADQLKHIMEETLDQVHLYQSHRMILGHGHHGHHKSGLGGAIGGFAAGLFGGMLAAEMMDELMDGAEEAFGDFEGEEEDGFFDGLDFFGDEED
jgi:sporulation-control protein